MLFKYAVLPLFVSLAGSAVAAPHRLDASIMRRGRNAEVNGVVLQAAARARQGAANANAAAIATVSPKPSPRSQLRPPPLPSPRPSPRSQQQPPPLPSPKPSPRSQLWPPSPKPSRRSQLRPRLQTCFEGPLLRMALRVRPRVVPGCIRNCSIRWRSLKDLGKYEYVGCRKW
ncbi:hypothetical protein C8J57DRAFT_1722950, partial [Mycena rebaudengoi]